MPLLKKEGKFFPFLIWKRRAAVITVLFNPALKSFIQLTDAGTENNTEVYKIIINHRLGIILTSNTCFFQITTKCCLELQNQHPNSSVTQ